MDLSNAALLIASVYGIIELLKKLLPDAWLKNSRIVTGLVIAVSFAATFLVAATAWAGEQVIGDHRLDQLSVADKVLVSCLVAGAAALTNRGVRAVMNVGQNQVTDVQREALDAGAARLVQAQLTADAGGSHTTATAPGGPVSTPSTYTFAEPERVEPAPPEA